MKKFWPFTFYFLYFAAFASFLPYLVLFYQGRGFSGAQIGLLTGLPPLITLVASPFLTGIADARNWHTSIMGLGIVVSIAVSIVLQTLTSFAVVFAVILLFNFFLAPLSSLADSGTMAMLGEERAMYGRVRLGGTIGWGLFSAIAGVLVENHGLRLAFWSFAFIMAINFFVSQRFVRRTAAAEATEAGGLRLLLADRRWIHFLFLAFLGGLGMGTVNVYLFPYMAELGASESTMGLALTISTLTELPIFFFGHRLVRRFQTYGLFVAALVMTGIRSLLYGLAGTPGAVLLVQAFGGTIFPAMWVAAVSYADEHAPAGLKSSAQGLLGAMTFGVGSAVGGFAGGLLLESLGGRWMYVVIGVVIFAGLALAEGLRRLIPHKQSPPEAIAVASDK